jgi:hypothetical protein
MTSSITPLVAMQGTLEKMADKFTEANGCKQIY